METPQQQPYQPPVMPQPVVPQSTHKAWVIPLVVVLVLAGGYFAFAKYQSMWPFSPQVSVESPTPSMSPNVSAHPTQSPSSTPSATISGNTKKIVFRKEIGTNPNHTVNTEVWIMDTDGTNATKLNLTGTNPISFNNISNGWVYYVTSQSKSANGQTIYAFNYLTNQSKQISELNQPNTVVNVGGEVVSPDSKKILYQISYTQLVNGSPVCGQESCPDVDFYPDHKSGTYVYDIETDKKVFLGNFSFITQWDDNSQNIFTTQGSDYHESKLAGGYYSISTDTGVATLQSTIPSQNFYYYYRYLVNGSNKQIVSENVRLGGAATQNGDIKVIQSGTATTVDTGNICTYSTCLSISSDAKYALYIKSDGNNLPTKIMLLDLTALSTKVILQAQAGQSFNHPTWISSSQIVVESSTGNYPNDKHNLLLVNVTSGTVQSLTSSGNARMY